MDKKLLLILIALPLFAVNAQTFQRRAQQPAFFMPKSVMTAPQPERLPTVDSMNYQGQHISNEASSPFIGSANEREEVQQVENEDENNNVPVEAKVPALKQYAAPKPATVKTEVTEPKQEQKQIAVSQPEPKENPSLKKTAPKSEIATKDKPETYQEIFAQVLDSHRKDLKLISQGQAVNNPEIEQMIESYVPKVHKITDTIDIRTIKL